MVVYDHNGSKYNSITDMCAAYHITRACYRQRRKRGMSVEQALNTPSQKNGCVKGQNGRVYNSKEEMLYDSDIATSVYYAHPDISISKLHKKKKAKKIVDHNGKEYNSLTEMMKAYQKDRWVYYHRLKLGWTLKDILEKPLERKEKH